MSASNLFGPWVSGAHVEAAVAAALNLWMDDYLYEIERDPVLGFEAGQIQRPLGVITASQFEKWPEDQLPVILVLSPGMSKPPTQRAEGILDGEWRVGLAPVVSDVDQPGTRTLAQAYAAAVRLFVAQHSMLKSPLFPDGFSHYVDLVGEDYTDIQFQQSRTVMAGQVVMNVGVENITTKQAGPRTPTVPASEDPGPWPAADPSFTVEPRALTESLT